MVSARGGAKALEIWAIYGMACGSLTRQWQADEYVSDIRHAMRLTCAAMACRWGCEHHSSRHAAHLLTRAEMTSRWVGEHHSPCHAAHPLTRAAMASRWIHKRYSSCDSAHLHLHTNPLNPRINIILTAVHRARHVLLYVWQTALISCPLSPIYAQAAPAHRKNSIDIHLPLEIKYNHRTHCACGHPYMKGAA